MKEHNRDLAEFINFLDEARKRSSGKKLPVEFHQGDIYALPFPEATFDVTRKIRHFESDRRTNGLADLQVRAVVHMNCNYEKMLSFRDIRELVRAAQKASALSSDEGVAWLEQLAQAGQPTTISSVVEEHDGIKNLMDSFQQITSQQLK